MATRAEARWYDYLLLHGVELDAFLESHLRVEREVLLILGRGFDPRMCGGAEAILRAAGAGRLHVLAIEYHEGGASPSRIHSDLVSANWSRLESLLAGRAHLESRAVTMYSSDGRRIGARSSAALFQSGDDLGIYSDILVDISAMPRVVYVPLIAKLLYLVDMWARQDRRRPNLFVLVGENPGLDAHILDEGVEDVASYIHPFSGSLEREATAGQPKIWIPLLGERQGPQLERIHDLVVPDEICPVLPSPSRNPRRGDDLVLEHRYILFDRLRVEPQNFIYAAEWNPFEVYRQIRRTVFQYRDALRPLGGCKVALSALSTKLMSVGAFLVAYELKQLQIDVALAHVESQGYVMEHGTAPPSELVAVWLAGECYEP